MLKTTMTQKVRCLRFQVITILGARTEESNSITRRAKCLSFLFRISHYHHYYHHRQLNAHIFGVLYYIVKYHTYDDSHRYNRYTARIFLQPALPIIILYIDFHHRFRSWKTRHSEWVAGPHFLFAAATTATTPSYFE